MKKLLFILLLSLCFGEIVPLERDVANHAFIGACLTKIVDEYTLDDELTFLIMTGIFFSKESFDLDKTGFSLNDLV